MTHNFLQFLLIGLAAACGAWLRFLTGIIVHNIYPGLPLGTLVVNLLGGLFMGMSIAYFENFSNSSEEVKLIINIGLLGGLTTYSAYTADIFYLIREGVFINALVFIFAHIIGALMLCYIGYYLINLFLQPS